MAGGPIFPYSQIPVTTDRVFPYIYIGAGTISKHEEGMGVQASVGADATWRLRFQMPPSLPTGSPKVVLLAMANATTGNAKVSVKCADVAPTADPSSATLTSSGTNTIAWAAGGNDKYNQTKVACPVTPSAGNILVCDLVFETASWTLAQISSWQAFVIWE